MDKLPLINASLNAISTILLVTGFVFIRNKNVATHRRLMKSAFGVSIAFLVGYIVHKIHLYSTTGSYNTQFAGTGVVRSVYFTVLVSHVVLAAVTPFLAFVTLYRGIKMDVIRHRRIARITLPIWLYVSVTGVLVYFMLYQWYSVA
jgi:uncharacterized membrane protein YozB (DUF420 family)